MEEQKALLCKAMTNNKPWIVIGILNEHPQLIKHGLDSRESILMMALKRNSSVELIEKLIQLMPQEGLAMTDNNGDTVLHIVENSQLATLLVMKSPNLPCVCNNLGETPLMTAIMKKYSFEYIVKVIEMTPEEGLCMQDVDGNTVLHMASMTGDIELAKLLMKCPTLLRIRNNYHYLPIHLSVIQGHSHMQKYLLSVAEQQGYYDPHAEVTSEDLLRSAIRAGMNDVAITLSYNQPLLGSNLGDESAMQDNLGNTLLHMAAMIGDIELAELLLMKCPTLLRIHNNSQYLPIHLAVIRGHSHMKEYLISVARQQGYDDPYADVTREYLLHSAIHVGMNDVAIALSYNHPLLVSNLCDESAKSTLLKAIRDGIQEKVQSILSFNPELTTRSLTASGETPILVATKENCSFDMIKIIVDHTSDEALAQTTDDGYTALHDMAIHGSTQLASLLLSRSPNLLHIRNNSGDLPINISIKNNHKDLTNYLFNKAIEEGYGDPFMGSASSDVLVSVLIAGMYDLASWIDQKYPDLAANSSKVLEFLATNLSVFRALQPFDYRKATLLRPLECILPRKLSVPRPVLGTMLSSICERVANQGNDNASSVFTVPFLLAAKNGSETIVSEILTHHPNAINFVDEDGHYIYHLAVMYRHKNIFKIAYQSNVLESRHLSSRPDNNGNHVLHLPGHPPNENRLGKSNRVILQMQRELKWFKELENLLFPINSMQLNREDKTPWAVFNEKHKDLVAKEIQWMTSMASASSVVASLIATVTFAAAITVPGGNNSNGMPMFSNHKSFLVFAVSDALALFASVNCVLSFLAVFTSRYGVDDFLYALPIRLIIGLISLFISALSLIVAFGTTLFLVFGQQHSLILIPIIVFSCAPVIQYCFLQIPSLVSMIKSTYGGKLLV